MYCRTSILLSQTDVTARSEMEAAMAQLAQSQMEMLGQVGAVVEEMQPSMMH